MRFFPVLLLALCCFSCEGDVAPETTSAATETKIPEASGSNELVTGLLDSYPEGLVESGCGCTLNLEDGEADDLFFVFDWKGNGGGMIRINDEDVVLQRGASLKTANQKHDSYLHQSDKWTVKTSINDRGQDEDKGNTYTGKVRISNQLTGVKKEYRVKGVCSCE